LKKMTLKQSAEYFIEAFSLPLSVEQIIDRLNEMAEEKYQNDVELKPYVFAYLKKLQAEQVRMGIATAADLRTTKKVLARLGILDCFEFILTCTEMGCSKEEPGIFYRAAEIFGARPGETVVFEDALHSIKTAKEAGFIVVGVGDESSKNEKEEIKRLCHLYIDSFEEMEVQK